MRAVSPPDDHPTRPRGRPRVEAKLEEMVSARVSLAQYQQLQAIADRRAIGVATLVRELLVFRLR